MKNLLFVLALFCFVGVYAQPSTATGYKGSTTDTKSKVKQKGKSYNQNYFVKNEEARFKFGEDSLQKYIYAKLVQTPEFQANTIEGHILISWEVNYDAKVMNVAVIEGVGTSVDEAMKTIVKGMKDFLPAQQNGIDYRSEIIMDFPIKPR